MSKSLVRGWSWHRLRRITGQLVFYYGQITASLIHPPATATASSEGGYLAYIKLHNSCLFISIRSPKSAITTTDKSLYYIYFWTLHVKMLCNLSHLYCWTACWDGLLKVPLSTIPQSTCWGSILVLGTQAVLRYVVRFSSCHQSQRWWSRLSTPLMLNITIMKTLKPQ